MTATPNGHRGRTGDRAQVAMVGTYDVANFGDLLFPLIAQHELEQRLGPFDLTLYSYGPMTPPTWSLHVQPIAELRREISRFDLLLLGGGHAIRADTAIAPGYLPNDPAVHHPLGLWLTPALLAAAAGVPVAWNAPSASADIPATLTPLIDLAVQASDYVALRDPPSVRIIGERAPDARLHLVPDTAFGIEALLPREPSERFASLCRELGLSERYVVVQSTPQLLPYLGAVSAIVEHAVGEGMVVVDLPIGPVHGDEAGILGLPAETRAPSTWPEPRVVAELLMRSQGVVAVSLHAGIMAAVAGVPLFRPAPIADSKYEILDRIPGVYHLPLNGSAGDRSLQLGRHQPSAPIRDYVAELRRHWDRVAALVGSTSSKNGAALVLEIVERLPRVAAQAHDAMLDGLEESQDEIEALRARCADLEAIARRRSVRIAMVGADRLARLRA